MVYSGTLVTFWRVYRHSDHWLSSNAMQKLIRNEKLHSQTVQGIVQTFYEALKSWSVIRKTDPNAKPPRRLSKYHPMPFKSSAIKLNDGTLTLSTGRGNEPIRIPWKFELPRVCEITFNGEEYVLNAVYEAELPAEINGKGHAGVEFGDVHMAAVYTGQKTNIANGRELRSKSHYRDHVKAHFMSEMSKCKKDSRKWNRMNRARKRTMRKLNHQVKDIMHKQTNAIVCVMKNEGTQTVGIGNVRNTGKDIGYRSPIGTVRKMIAYKSERMGMTVKYIIDEHSGRVCPYCGQQNNKNHRIFKCGKCGFERDKDCVSAINIRSLAEYREYVPVIGDMTPPVGIRYYADSLRTSAAKPA